MADRESDEHRTQREERLKVVLKSMGLSRAAAIRGALDEAAERSASLSGSDPQKGQLEAISSIEERTADKALYRFNSQGWAILQLISSVLAKRDPGTASIDIRARQYHRFLLQGVPLESAGAETAAEQLLDIFPFKKLELASLKPADADAFYNAEPQGLAGICEGLDTPRSIFDGKIRQRLFSSNRSNWDLFLVTGPAGAGKSIILDRCSFETIKAGWSAFSCASRLVDRNTFFGVLSRCLKVGGDNILIVIDQAHQLLRRGVDLNAICTMSPRKENQRVTVVLSLNWQLIGPDAQAALPRAVIESGIYAVDRLNRDERNGLVHKIVDAEATGLIREPRTRLTTQERLSLIDDPRDQLALVALLKLRYGRNVREILREEFEAIPVAAREVLRSIALIEWLGSALTAQGLRRRLSLDPISANAIRHLTREEGGKVFVRHELLLRPTLDVTLPAFDVRIDFLVSVFLSLIADGDGPREVLIEVLTASRVAKRVERLMGHDQDRIRLFTQAFRELSDEFNSKGLGSLLYAFTGTIEKDILGDFARAADDFGRAIELDRFNRYALRQLAWSRFRSGDLGEAERVCGEAVERFGEDRNVALDCSYILSWCSTKAAFGEAGAILTRLSAELPDDEAVRRRLQRHKEGQRIADAVATSEFPDWAYEEMGAPRFVWRVRRGGGKMYKRAVFKELSGALSSDVDSSELLREAGNISIDRTDKKFTAVLEANLARMLYERWYKDDENIDLEAVGRGFIKARLLWPEEPFICCWYGTFLKEVRRDMSRAREEYELARAAAGRSQVDYIVEHPMILNNIALLHMDAVRAGQESPADGLGKARELVNAAMQRVEETKSRFSWPLATKVQLDQLWQQYGI